VPHPRTRLHSVSRKRPQTINTYGRFCKVNLGWGRPRDPQRPKALPRIQTKSREIDPNEYQQWRRGIITAAVTRCVLLWADQPL
jgi:hypothetical protein